MQNERIYTSPFPPLEIPNQSIFTYLLSSDNTGLIGGLPASAPAYVDADTGATLTRGDLKRHALSFGYGLRSSFKAKRGDVVLVYSGNSLHWPVVLFGSIAAGMVCSLANSAYNARELSHQYTDSGAHVVITSEDGLPVVQQALQNLGISKQDIDKRIVVLTSSLKWVGGLDVPTTRHATGLVKFENLLVNGSLHAEEKFDGKDAFETACLCYSSGTTGQPKGVETTHRNLVFVLKGSQAVFPPTSVHDKSIAVLPFYHIYGAVNNILFPLQNGIATVIMSRFDPIQFCAVISKYKINHAFVVPPMFVVFAKHPAVDKFDLSSLKGLYSAAAPLGPTLQKEVLNRLMPKRRNGDSLLIMQGYGLTETSPTATAQCVGSEHKLGSVGVLLPNTEARLMVEGEGGAINDAPEGERGEIWLRGPGVMKGYLNNPTATKNAITPDGWFKTGDVAVRDADGYYYIVDRVKELIKYKGFQVPPAELEGVILTHPEISDVAVIAVYSEKGATELPRAYVVPARPDQVKTEAQRIAFAKRIKDWTNQQVARHKYLRGGVVVIDVIPKSAAGKILRRELRERAKQELSGRDPGDDINAKL